VEWNTLAAKILGKDNYTFFAGRTVSKLKGATEALT
jgi:hypothetical protein